MTPDELLTHLEAELARCRDERDRLQTELVATRIRAERADEEAIRLEGKFLEMRAERDIAKHSYARLYQTFHSVLESKSWTLTRPLRWLRRSDRPEVVEPE